MSRKEYTKRQIEIMEAATSSDDAGVAALDSPNVFCPGTFSDLTESATPLIYLHQNQRSHSQQKGQYG